MQLLAFTVGDEEYAIASRRVIEVLPLVTPRPIPQMPDYVRGVFSHRGQLVPLVDLGWRLLSHPLRERLSTRVIVVEFSPAAAPTPQTLIRLGMVAENVLSLCSTNDAEASLPAMHPPAAPYLGQVLRIGSRTLQLLDIEHLLPTSLFVDLASHVSIDEPTPQVGVASHP
jgi:chemotaxis-related protein WspB